jgi:hypothetical protein
MSSTKQRRIDALPPKEDALEMEVLVLGMPRTGSICKALPAIPWQNFDF